MEFTKVIYKAQLAPAAEGEVAECLYLCRELNAYILWHDSVQGPQFVRSWMLRERDLAIEESVAIAKAERGGLSGMLSVNQIRAKEGVFEEEGAAKPEQKRAAMQRVKEHAAAGNVFTVKLLSAKKRTSSHKKLPFVAIKYQVSTMLGKPLEASCWIEPLFELLIASAGKTVVAKIESKAESGKVYDNLTDLLKVGDREVRRQCAGIGHPITYALAEAKATA